MTPYEAFEKLRQATFSDRIHAGLVCIPIAAWVEFEKVMEGRKDG